MKDICLLAFGLDHLPQSVTELSLVTSEPHSCCPLSLPPGKAVTGLSSRLHQAMARAIVKQAENEHETGLFYNNLVDDHRFSIVKSLLSLTIIRMDYH